MGKSQNFDHEPKQPGVLSRIEVCVLLLIRVFLKNHVNFSSRYRSNFSKIKPKIFKITTRFFLDH